MCALSPQRRRRAGSCSAAWRATASFVLICLRFLRRSGRTERTRRAERSSVVNCEQAIEAIQQGLGGAHNVRVGRPEVAGTLVGFSVVAPAGAGDIQATGDLGSTLLGSGLALGGHVLGGVHGDRAPSGWRRSAGHDCAYERHRRSGRRPGRVAQPGLESVGTRVCASHRGHPTRRTDRTGA